MNDLTTIVRQNREAAAVLPGFTGIGVSRSQPGAVNERIVTQREGCTVYANPRTGAKVNVRNG